jgi:RNA polymerase sigma-70 factor (ECF subfamily)
MRTASRELSEVDQYALRSIAARVQELITRYGFPIDDRDDLKQELFLKYREREHKFDPARGSYKTFVSSLIRNRAMSMVRQKLRQNDQVQFVPLSTAGRAVVPGEIDLDQTDVSDETGAEITDLTFAVRRVMASLPERLRYVASRIATDPVAEIATDLGICRDRVYQLIEQLRVAFREAGLEPNVAGAR